MAVSELCHFCSSIDLCRLQFTWQVKLKSQKPCTPLFSSTVISARGWQAQDINLNRNSWNYAFQKESATLRSYSKKLSPVIIGRGKQGVFREQSSLVSGEKEREEWWVFIRGLCSVPSHENCLNQHHGCSQCSLRRQHLFPTQVSDMGLHQQFIHLKPPSPSWITPPTLKQAVSEMLEDCCIHHLVCPLILFIWIM